MKILYFLFFFSVITSGISQKNDLPEDDNSVEFYYKKQQNKLKKILFCCFKPTEEINSVVLKVKKLQLLILPDIKQLVRIPSLIECSTSEDESVVARLVLSGNIGIFEKKKRVCFEWRISQFTFDHKKKVKIDFIFFLIAKIKKMTSEIEQKINDDHYHCSFRIFGDSKLRSLLHL